MGVDPEQDSTAEPEDALDPQAADNGSEDELGDAGTGKGEGFTDPISHF